MGDLRASEALNGLLIALIGTGLPQASETGARVSHEELNRFGGLMRALEEDIRYSVAHIGDSLPGDAGREYVRAMSVLTGADGGTNYLREYERSLRSVAAGHRDQSLNIQESKWQIIAELIRLVIELTILAATAWINPAAAGQAAQAKARSTTIFLTTLDLFLRRTHLMPSLSEALEEAFQTLVVRLGLMAFNDPDMRPSGVDWRAVWQSAAFGGAAGWLSGPLRNLADRFNGLFAKSQSRGLFKDLSGDVTSKSGRDLPNGTGGTGNSPQSFGDWLASSPRRMSEFVADGLTEALPETLLAMAFFGTPFSWSAFATTFWTSAVSEQTSDLLGEGVTRGVGNVREVYDDSALQAKSTDSVVGGVPPTTARGTTSGSGPTGIGGGGAKTRASLGTDVNALDVLDRIGAPGVTAPTTEPAPGTGRTASTDTESAQPSRTTASTGNRPVTERSVPDEILGTDRPDLAEEPTTGDATSPGTTAPTAMATATGAASTLASPPSAAAPATGSSPTTAAQPSSSPPSAGTARGADLPAAEVNRANATPASARPATGPEAARTTGTPPAGTSRPATTSSSATTSSAAATSSSATTSSAAATSSSTTTTSSAATDDQAAQGTQPTRGAEPSKPVQTAGTTARTATDADPAEPRFWDALRDDLAASWASGAPDRGDLSTALNIVRTHQKLTTFQPADQPSFADLDPGHLAVYAVAADLRDHNDVDWAEALSRRLAQGRPRAERGYLPGGSGRGRPGRPGEDTSGGSNSSDRRFGPRAPRSASSSSGTGSLDTARRPATTSTASTAVPPAPAPTTTSTSPSTSMDQAQPRSRRLPAPPASGTDQPASRSADPVRPDRSVEPSRSGERQDATATPALSSTPGSRTGASTGASTDQPVGGRPRPRQPMGARAPRAPRDRSVPANITTPRPDPALPGHAPRVAFRTVDVDDRPFEVLRVEPDGDCFMTSMLAGLSRQLPGSPMAGLTVRQLRDHVGDWLAGDSPAAVARRAELDSGPSPLQVLINDLRLAQLEDLLGSRAPEPTAEQLAAIDRDLSRPQFVRELLRRFPDPADRSVIGDFTAGMAAALLPDFAPDPSQIRPADRQRLVAELQLAILREEATRELAADTARSQELYATLIRPHRGLTRMFPLLQDMRRLTPSAAVESAVRNVDMWTTPFYDQVPQLTAVALDLNITPVQPIEDMGDLGFANPLNPSATRSLHVFYEGGNHYSAMNPVGGAVQVPPPVSITEGLLTGDSPVDGMPPEAPWSDLPPRPELAALTAVLRARGASDNLLARLHDLSPEAADRLAGMAARTQTTPALSTTPASDQDPPAPPGSVLGAGDFARSRRDAARSRTNPVEADPVVVTFPDRATDLGQAQRRTLDTMVELFAEQALGNARIGRPLPVLSIDTTPAPRSRFAVPGTRSRDEGAVRERAVERYVRDRLAEVLRDGQAAYRTHPVTVDDVLVETGAAARNRAEAAALSRNERSRPRPANAVRVTVGSPPPNSAQEELTSTVLEDEWSFEVNRAGNPGRGTAALQMALTIVRAHQRIAGFQVELAPEFGDLPLSHRAVYAVAAAILRNPKEPDHAVELSRTLAENQPPPQDVPRQNPRTGGRRTFGRPSGDRSQLPAPPPVTGGTTFVTTGQQHVASPVDVPVRTRPYGQPRVQVLPLVVMTPTERDAALLALTADERSWIARDRRVVQGLRDSLSREEFARTAAVLMVDVAPGVDQPVSARREAHRLFAALLQDPDTAERVLTSGARVTVIPKDVRLTDVEPFTSLAGRALSGGRVWDDVRGTSGTVTAISEENLLGEISALVNSEYADGYSTAAHELAHVVHKYGLSDEDRRAIDQAFENKLQLGSRAEWPDGIRLDLHGTPTDNYSATDPFEYFAQLTNAYFQINKGTDPATGRPRNNGLTYVHTHERPLRVLLERLYGPRPTLLRTGPVNPVEATREENETYDAVRRLFPDLPPLHDNPPPDDTPVGDLVRWNGPLTLAQTHSVTERVRELGNTARLSAIRIIQDRLRKRAARLEGTRFQDSAQSLETWVTGELDLVQRAPGMDAPPKVINFFWVGRPLSPAGVANVLAWAEVARTHGWTVQMWTDTTPVTMDGSGRQQPSLSEWSPGTEELFKQEGIRFRSARELFPLDRPPAAGDEGFTLEDQQLLKLRTIYDRARTNPTAFPVASDVARLAIMLYDGGTYADVDLEPGTAEFSSPPRKMGRSDIPLIGPMFRDQSSFRQQRAEFAQELGLRPEDMTMVDVAAHAMTHGRFGNALMSTVPQTAFFRQVINAIDGKILTWNAEELALGGAFLTGPLTFTRAVAAQIGTYGLGEIDGAEHGVAVDPHEVRRWAHAGWLTEESENQVERVAAGPAVPGQLPPPQAMSNVSTVSGGAAFTGSPSRTRTTGLPVGRAPGDTAPITSGSEGHRADGVPPTSFTATATPAANVSGGTVFVSPRATPVARNLGPDTGKDLPALPPVDRSTDERELASEEPESASRKRELTVADEESVSASTSPEDKPLTVRFPKGSRTMADSAHESLRDLARQVAREALRDHAAGRTPRPIRVRGRGNDAYNAGYTAKARAKNTARVLEAYLAVELRSLQTDARSPLTTGDIAILHGYEDTAGQHRTDPYERRTAIVTLGDEGPDGVTWTRLREAGHRDTRELAETPTRILFARGDKAVPDQGRQVIEDLVDRIAVRALRERTPGDGPTVIRVAGRGNGRNTAEATGTLRATNTGAAVEQALARRLAELQSGATDPLTIDDFTVETVYDDAPRAIYEDPLTHRQAIITVDWPPRKADAERGQNTALSDDAGRGPTVEVIPIEGSLLALRSPSVPGNGFVEAVLIAHRDSIRETTPDWYLDDGTPDPETVLWLRKEMVTDLIGSDVRGPLPPFPTDGLTVSSEELDLIGAEETLGREREDGSRELGPDDLTPLQYTRLLLLRSDGWNSQIAELAVERISSLLTHDLTLFDLDNGTTHAAGPGIGSGRLVLTDGRFHWTQPHDRVGQDTTIGFAAMRKQLAARWSQGVPAGDDITLAHNVVRTHQRLTSFEPDAEPDFATLDPAHLAVYAVALDLRTHGDEEHAEDLSRQLAQGRDRAVRGYMPGGSGKGKGRKPRPVVIYAGEDAGGTVGGSGGHGTGRGQAAVYSQYGMAAVGSSGDNPAPVDWHGMTAHEALRQLRAAPKRFLDNNVLMSRMDEGIVARFGVSQFVAFEFMDWMNSQNQHWFALTKDTSRTAANRQPVYLLTPAVEKYVEMFGRHELRLQSIVKKMHLPSPAVDDSYVRAHFIPYLTGGTANPDDNVGHTEIPVDGGMGSFGSFDFVFTPGMNGCALVVTMSRVSDHNFTAWHYQSPGGRSNVEDAQQFRVERSPFEWFGHEQYMTSVPGMRPEATNFMWRPPEGGWRILSQDNHVPFKETNWVTTTKVMEKQLGTGRQTIDVHAIYKAMADERYAALLKGDREKVQGLKKNGRNKNVARAYEIVLTQARIDAASLARAVLPRDLVNAGQTIRQAHAAMDIKVRALLAKQDDVDERPLTGLWGNPKTDDDELARNGARSIIADVSDPRWFQCLERESAVLAGRSFALSSPGTGPHDSYAPTPGATGRVSFSPLPAPSQGYASYGATGQGWSSPSGTQVQGGWPTAGGGSGLPQVPRSVASPAVPVPGGTAYVTYPSYSIPLATGLALAPASGGSAGQGSSVPMYPAYTTDVPSGSATSSSYGYGYYPTSVPGSTAVPAPGGTAFTGYPSAAPRAGFRLAPPPPDEYYGDADYGDFEGQPPVWPSGQR
ncbi:hypothetical protein ACIPSE_34195 [Streptomyces sp. NPDC090106]|uniref:hypothetical protein n=1 Tax=Streptomyces sp. NPDC090106 TaxID=3365946 RepID=UPI00382F562C